MAININYKRNLKGRWLKPVTPLSGYHLDPKSELNRDYFATSSALVINGVGKSKFVKKAIERVKYVNKNRETFGSLNSEISDLELAKELLKNKLTPDFVFEDIISRIPWVSESLLENEEFKKECIRLIKDPENWGVSMDDPRINQIVNSFQGEYSFHTDGGSDGSMVVFLSNEDSTELEIGHIHKNRTRYYDGPAIDDNGNELTKFVKPKTGAAIMMPQQDGAHSNPNFPNKSIPKKMLEVNERVLLRNVFFFNSIAKQAALNIGFNFDAITDLGR